MQDVRIGAVFLRDGITGGILLRTKTGKLNDLRTSCPQGVRPFIWPFRLYHTSGDLIEEVGGGYGTIERRQEVGGKRI